MSNYSKKVTCVECGQVFPASDTQLLASGKSVLRLCNADYERKAPKAEVVKAEVKER